MSAETKTVYVVTSGEYSDYSINAMFSTRESAQAYCDAIARDRKYDLPQIEEWALDEFADRYREGLAPYFVEMLRDGTVNWLQPAGSIEARCSISKCPDRKRGWPNQVTALSAIVWARDKEHAVEIVNDRRTQMIALGEWAEEQQ